jgi:hypothetical protein
MILTAPLAALGLTAGQQFSFYVLAFDNYFTGSLTDYIDSMTYTVGVPRFYTAAASYTVPAGGSLALLVEASLDGETASPSQSGLLFLYRDAMPGAEADTLLVNP